jgi:DNA-binding NarL/FixJ family response regulator
MTPATDQSGDPACRVLVIDDHELLSSALRAAFSLDGRAEVVATAESIAEGVRMAGATKPDVILTDRRLPDGDIDQHVGRLLEVSPGSRVMMMTGWPTERSSLAALDSGVTGIVSKADPVSTIVAAVLRVAAGELLLPASLAPLLLRRSGQAAPVRAGSLSGRELDVIEALAAGESTTIAAQRLCMSPNTLRNHLARAMAKLGAHDRLGAVSQATRLGLIAPRMPASSGGRSDGRS